MSLRCSWMLKPTESNSVTKRSWSVPSSSSRSGLDVIRPSNAPEPGVLVLSVTFHGNKQSKLHELLHKWMFPKIGVPHNGWFILENPIKMDDLGVPLFSETPKSLGSENTQNDAATWNLDNLDSSIHLQSFSSTKNV